MIMNTPKQNQRKKEALKGKGGKKQEKRIMIAFFIILEK